MRASWIVAAVTAAGLTVPVAAQVNKSTSQQIEGITTKYIESWDRQDAGGIAALFTRDGVLLSQAPPKPFKIGTQEIEQTYRNVFATGANHIEIRVEQIVPLGRDAVIALSEYHVNGQGQNGPINIIGHATALDIRQGGTWKIRLLSAVPNAPPPSALTQS